jgi:hypothetical protein
MRIVIVCLAVSAAGPALADQISGKWVLGNGNKLVISGNTWSGVGYAGRDHRAHSGAITRTSPTTFKFHDVNGLTRDCVVSGSRVKCTPFGSTWRRG